MFDSARSAMKLSFMDVAPDFDGEVWVKYTQEHAEIPIFAVSLYLIIVFTLPQYIKRELPVKFLWALWNLLLSVFSIAGALVMIPHLGSTIYEHGLRYTLCTDPRQWYLHGTPGLFTVLFIYSKIPELVDTLFLVLRRRPVIFLHWFHHLTVLLYCWHAYHNTIAPGAWFATMNYFVHSIMYFYYFLACFRLSAITKPLAPFITVIQIAQMVVGTYVTFAAAFEHMGASEPTCHVLPSNYKMGMAMYVSYLLLFVKLFHSHYIAPSGKHSLRRKDGTGMACSASDSAGFFHESKPGETPGNTPATMPRAEPKEDPQSGTMRRRREN